MILMKLGWAARERGWRVVSSLLAVAAVVSPYRLLSRRYWQKVVARGPQQYRAGAPRRGRAQTNPLSQRAKQFLRAGRYPEAADVLLKAMALVPESLVVRGDLRTQYAQVCLYLGDTEKALEQIAEARRELLAGWASGWRAARRAVVFCRTSLVLAEVQHQMGYTKTALQTAKDALDFATENAAPVAIQEARRALQLVKV